MGTLDLSDEWSYLAYRQVDPSKEKAELEFPFRELVCSSMKGLDFSKAFFRFRIPEMEEGWDWEEVEEEGGDPPDIPLPVFLGDGFDGVKFFATNGQTVTETVPVVPGCQYLVEVQCLTMEYHPALTPPGITPPNYDMSWDFTGPGGQSFSGSTDVHTLGENLTEAYFGSSHHMRVFRIPLPEESPSGASTTGESIALSLTVGDDSTSTSFSAVQARIKPIRLTQANMPTNAVQKVPGSTDFGVHLPHGTNIVEGGTAFITGEPYPPSLWVSVAGNTFGSGVSVAYRLEIESERWEYRGGKKNKTLDYRDLPGDGEYTPFSYDVSSYLTRDLMKFEVIGGKCTLHYKIRSDDKPDPKDQETGTYEFYIRGMNPKDATAKAYINSIVDPRFLSYAWAIAQHESREPGTGYVFCQFNATGQYKHRPNKTGDTKDKDGNPVKQYGWGMGQIDKGNPSLPANSNNFVTTAEVYNWKTNCLSIADTLIEKRDTYTNYLSRIKETYSKEWEEPPATTNLFGVTWTHEQFAVTVMYNGSSKKRGIPPTSVWGKDKNGKKVLVDIYCPLVFHPSRLKGQRWEPRDNNRDYAQKVAKELLNQLPITE